MVVLMLRMDIASHNLVRCGLVISGMQIWVAPMERQTARLIFTMRRSSADRRLPSIIYGINAAASWKGFDLSMLFQGSDVEL